MVERMTDIIQRMIDAYNTEWLLWDWAADNPGQPSTLYTVKRGEEIICQGDYYEALHAHERESERAAMKAAVRVMEDG